MKRRHAVATLFLVLIGSASAWAQNLPAKREQIVAEIEASKAQLSTLEAWSARKAQLREAFLKGADLWPLPAKTPLSPIVFNKREYDGYSVENVALETFPGFYCTGNLYRPLKSASPGPGVLSPHGHFRDGGRMRPDQQIRCAHLARLGATVFSYSLVGWQDSTQTTHDDPLVMTLQTWNSVRALDYLCSLPKVDAERIGITGASGGGTQSIFLAAIDERVAACAPVGIVYPWTPPGCCKCEGAGRDIFKPQSEGAAPSNGVEFSALIAPRPQLFISMGGDETRDFPTVGLPFVRSIYTLYGHPGRCENVHLPDEGHDYGPSKRKAMYDFFARFLDMPRAEEDLARIAIETPEQMEVFGPDRPHPAHALQGADAIGKAFAALPREEPATLTALEGDDYFFIPKGSSTPGQPKTFAAEGAATLKIRVLDEKTDGPTPCRVSVIGPDGNYYQPKENGFTPYNMTGEWPKNGAWGNRTGKAPYRYMGHFFYSDGEVEIPVPEGKLRIEVSKGFEYRPQSTVFEISAGETESLVFVLRRALDMPSLGWHGGDMHLHIPRESEDDDNLIFDLLAAEDIHFGALLAYNEPAGPYAGEMKTLASPQYRGLGRHSLVSKNGVHLLSGQEYRNATFGHLLLFQRDDLVFPGENFNADLWPVYGLVGQQTQALGGYAIYAHGGYRQEIYADAALGAVNGVELLQFGIYRELGLADWYDMHSAGYRFPMIGASDWPACRWLGDCRTYVAGGSEMTFPQYLEGMAAGKSFATTGPMLLLDVASGAKKYGPGDTIELAGEGPHEVQVKVRVASEAAPLQFVDVIVDGRIERAFGARSDKSDWQEFSLTLPIAKSSWIAARAWGAAPGGRPNAEAHSNPVYLSMDGKQPHSTAAIDRWIARIDEQIAKHRQRDFAEKAQVLDYFQSARDKLLEVREVAGTLRVPSADLAEDASRPDPTAEDLREFLKPVPPLKPAEALKSFETAGPFEMQLVAAEPLVVDPIAAAFDADGALYVCEMRDYPYKPAEGKEPIGTVRLLRDTDGDGVFDRSTIFADKLLWAAGVAPWKGGAFVAAAPDIWYLRDDNGDDIADVRKKVFTGFGTENQQAMVNNLTWGLDGKIYGVTAGNGGLVSRPDAPDTAPVNLTGRDFRFDPETLVLEPIEGSIQFGNTFDDFGRRFTCSESQPMLHAVLPLEYTQRNPFLSPPASIVRIADTPTPIFRISPIERWRQVRSSRRIASNERPADMPGASHHVIDAAAGLTIYRGGAYPAEYYGSAFLGDGQNNLIHRRLLSPSGVTFTTKRGEEGTEIVRSSDIWFRPVNFVNAPDGSLYCLDMSREVLESIHIPLDVVAQLNLTSGRDRGRIYRLAPQGFKSPPPVKLSQASDAALVEALESPHGYFRDTAMRLLCERRAATAAPMIAALVVKNDRPATRVAALRLLGNLNAASEQTIAAALQDVHAGVRENALKVAERQFARSPLLRAAAIELTDDDDPRVRLQAAFSLGAIDDSAATDALIAILKKHGGDPYLNAAVLSSLPKTAAHVFARIAADESFVSGASGPAVLEQLAMLVGAAQREGEVAIVLDVIATAGPLRWRRALGESLMLSLGERLRRSGRWLVASAGDGLGSKMARRLFEVKAAQAGDASAAGDVRVAAMRWVACCDEASCLEIGERLLAEPNSETVQVAAIEALARLSGSGERIAKYWKQYSPEAAKAALDALLASEEGCRALLQAAEEGLAIDAALDASRRQLLLTHPQESIREFAKQRFGETNAQRGAIVADYRQKIADLPGRVETGRTIFQQKCANCHQLEGQGFVVGPSLAATALRDAETLLTHILDPNRYVAPNYMQYSAVDSSGRIFSGLLASQTADSITLRREKGVADVIPRNEIEELSATGKSLMPEGLEKEIDPAAMADLAAYISHVASQAPQAENPNRERDFGTLPGLIEK